MNTTEASFSVQVREATKQVHSVAESERFITALLDGVLPREGYVALAAQHYFIYAALETAAEAMREDPMAGPFVDDALHRLATLEADLAFLIGPDWAEKISPIPATAAYAARIRDTCATSATAYIAHHYTRYIGDLSGGVMIGRVVNRTFGLVDGVGAKFYEFDGIPAIPTYKKEYRAKLDSLPLDGPAKQALIDEVVVAYGHNTAVFAELAELVPATPKPEAQA